MHFAFHPNVFWGLHLGVAVGFETRSRVTEEKASAACDCGMSSIQALLAVISQNRASVDYVHGIPAQYQLG